MTVKEQASVILDQLDIYAPAHINMNLREDWIAALVLGIAEIKRRETEADRKEIENGIQQYHHRGLY